jgi:hypothetical protein
MNKIKIKHGGKLQSLEVSFGKMFLANLSTELGVGLEQISEVIASNPVMTSLQIMLISLKEGARISKKEFGLTIEDLADAWDLDEDLVERFFEMLNDGVQPKKEMAVKS